MDKILELLEVYDPVTNTWTTSEKDLKLDSNQKIFLIVNRFSEEWSTSVIKEYDMIQAVSLPNIPMAFYHAEAEKKSLRNINKYYDKQLDKLTNLVALQTEYKITQKKKAGGFFGMG